MAAMSFVIWVPRDRVKTLHSVNLSLNILLDCNSIRLNNYLVLQMHSGFKWLNCFDEENDYYTQWQSGRLLEKCFHLKLNWYDTSHTQARGRPPGRSLTCFLCHEAPPAACRWLTGCRKTVHVELSFLS